MNVLGLIPGTGWVKLAVAAAAVSAVVGAASWAIHYEREIGRAEVRADWDADKLRQRDADLRQAKINADETERRLAAQKENQDAQDKELARARDDAARNAADAGQLRHQNASTAKQWRDALGNSPTVVQCQAAGAAITVQADLLGRSDSTSSELAAYADAARAAGLKCERDYDALTPTRMLKLPP